MSDPLEIPKGTHVVNGVNNFMYAQQGLHNS